MRENGKKLKWAYDKIKKKLREQTRRKQQEPGKEKYLARRSEDQDRRVTWENWGREENWRSKGRRRNGNGHSCHSIHKQKSSSKFWQIQQPLVLFFVFSHLCSLIAVFWSRAQSCTSNNSCHPSLGNSTRNSATKKPLPVDWCRFCKYHSTSMFTTTYYTTQHLKT